MLEIRKIYQTDTLPTWFEEKRWKDAKTKNYLDKPENFYVISDDQKIIGAAQIVYRNCTKEHHLGSLYIEEKYRGKKLGQKLIQKLLKNTNAKNIYLDTSKPYLNKYYSKLGFTELKNNLKVFQKELLIRHPEKDIEKQIFMVCEL